MQAEMVSVFLVDFASTLHRNNLQPQHSESGAPEGDAVLTKSIAGLRINVARGRVLKDTLLTYGYARAPTKLSISRFCATVICE